jgi:hypothetical protein
MTIIEISPEVGHAVKRSPGHPIFPLTCVPPVITLGHHSSMNFMNEGFCCLKGIFAALSGLFLLQGATSNAQQLADSIAEFSGDQGRDGWLNGHRNLTLDAGIDAEYDPDVGFIPFVGGEGVGEWDGFGQQWTGTAWDMETAAAGPWTFQGPESLHPNGVNSFPNEEHWAIRRWVADELAGPTALEIIWHTRKGGSGGNGVTGALFHNGKRVSRAVIGGTDTTGITRTNYVTAAKADKIDLVLTPQGTDGARGDGSDGSFNWLRVAVAADTDGDGLPDGWENLYFTNDLTRLSATGDADGDGLNDPQEYSAATNPARSDSDGDGVADGAEVTGETDPSDPNSYSSTTIVANSSEQFSGVQGQDGWYSGYRIVSGTGPIVDYPTNEVTLFPGGEEAGEWDGTTQVWTGSQWDLNTAAAAPWTELGPSNTHPNGNNNGATHWTVRRWRASGMTSVTPMTLRYHTHKGNTGGGNGVTGAVYVNGKLLDSILIAGTDGVGTTRAVYANIAPNDLVDLILSPLGADGANGDGSDGSVNRLEIDTTLPPNATQPSGAPFIPATGADSDGDGLPDVWERLYAPDLTRFSRTGDFDGDGLSDFDEYLRESDPTKADTDGDGLTDSVETNTGVFVSATDTGSSPTKTDTDGDGLTDAQEVNGTPRTDPNKADSDSDGFTDPEELQAGTDPNDAEDNVLAQVIANSTAEFSGVQGQNGWHNGYRNYTADGETTDYDPATGFIPYVGGPDAGPWDGFSQQWTGGEWDLETAAAGPWTAQSQLGLHPNGNNSNPFEEHWAIRRWVADELTAETPVAIIWQVRKSNTAGDGITGSLHINGIQVDAITIAGSNNTNGTRRFYANLKKGDIVDLAVTPEGITSRADGSDGSESWFWVDKKIPAEPRQPNGSLFIPANSPDTDGDGLPDFWEEIYAGNLTALNVTGDFDSDTLTDVTEFQRQTDPTKADTDDDGLSDAVETNTGTFVSAANTGTDPLVADTDGDGVPDGAEVTLGLNPTDAESNSSLADSAGEFSDVQGQDGWSYGYRNYTLDGGGENYNPTTGFIEFTPELWTGTQWDMNTEAAGPWTELGPENSHPNGAASAPNEEHWTIRRWSPAGEITEERPLALRWNVRKTNLSGTGVTGALYINGVLVDESVIAGNDGVGTTRTFYALVKPTDVIDLVHSPVGLGDDRADGADGSALWLRVDSYVPADARQPDGTPFVPGGQLEISGITAGATQVTLRWSSSAGATYKIEASGDLSAWTTLRAGHPATGTETTYTDSTSPLPSVRFYRVARE